MHLNIRFQDRSVVVTGAGHGIGRAIAVAFARCGAGVWACGIDSSGLEEVRPLLGANGRVETIDVTDPAAIEAMVARLERDRGRVDVLVNNAGGVRGQTGLAIERVSDAAWKEIMDVNLTGTFNWSRAVAPGMKRAGRGSIVNISSGAGLGVSLTGIQAYASAKAGQIGLTRQLAHELGPFGIRVNAIAPGFIRSNPDTERQWQAYGEDRQKRLVESIALRRLGTPSDVVDPVLFLASDHASWITGQVLRVDGGR